MLIQGPAKLYYRGEVAVSVQLSVACRRETRERGAAEKRVRHWSLRKETDSMNHDRPAERLSARFLGPYHNMARMGMSPRAHRATFALSDASLYSKLYRPR